MLERLYSWMEIAEKRLKPVGIPLYIIPGNDDDPYIDQALAGQEGVFNPDGRKFVFKDEYEVIGMAEANMTPWHCPRDVSEEVLQEKITRMVGMLERPETSIWLIHDAPHNSLLDECPVLDSELRIVASAGQVLMQAVGSTSVRKSIEQYQPLLTIHGHVHESPGARKIGRTLSVNPGSEYAEGILRALIINVEPKKVRGHMPISA